VAWWLRNAVQKAANALGYQIVSSNRAVSFGSMDPIIATEFGHIYDKCKQYTMTSVERMYALHKAVEHIVDYGIVGDLVECGVWKGGSLMVMAYTLLEKGDTSRKIYAYDTFEGMTEPSAEDFHLDAKDYRLDNMALIKDWRLGQRKDHNESAYASLQEVTRNVLSTGYPPEKFVFVPGRVEDTIPKVLPKAIALLRLDTDWYESTKHELNYLFPLLSRNGFLIVDDYGYWAGSKKAVDEYFRINHIQMFLNRIDYKGRMGIRT